MYAPDRKNDKEHRQASCQSSTSLIGLPLYGIGLVMALGHFVGLQTDLGTGLALWFAVIAMFVFGHMIEGNIWSITPVLLFRLISKIANNLVMKRLHLFPT